MGFLKRYVGKSRKVRDGTRRIGLILQGEMRLTLSKGEVSEPGEFNKKSRRDESEKRVSSKNEEGKGFCN